MFALDENGEVHFPDDFATLLLEFITHASLLVLRLIAAIENEWEKAPTSLTNCLRMRS